MGILVRQEEGRSGPRTEACVSVQLESRHFFQMRDTVQDRNGRTGTVQEGWSLYAVVAWEDGRREEVDQFDPRVVVIQRGDAP